MTLSNPSTSKSNIKAPHRGFYILGALATVGMVVVAVLDIAVTFVPGSASPSAGAVLDWFTLFNANAFYGLRGLGLLNIITVSCGLVIFFALYLAHRGGRAENTATIALLVMTLASAVYLSNNRALPMLSLSQQYQAASSQAERDILTAAGAGMLAQGEDFTPGTFLGFTLTETAGVIMSLALLRGKIFGRWSTLTWLGGYLLLIVYSSLVCFHPENLEPLMPISMIGGLMNLAGLILIALRLLRLAKSEAEVI